MLHQVLADDLHLHHVLHMLSSTPGACLRNYPVHPVPIYTEDQCCTFGNSGSRGSRDAVDPFKAIASRATQVSGVTS